MQLYNTFFPVYFAKYWKDVKWILHFPCVANLLLAIWKLLKMKSLVHRMSLWINWFRVCWSNFVRWRTMLYIASLPGFVLALGMQFAVDSPRWLCKVWLYFVLLLSGWTSIYFVVPKWIQEFLGWKIWWRYRSYKEPLGNIRGQQSYWRISVCH